MDIQLPGANGFELTRRLKSDPLRATYRGRAYRLCDAGRQGNRPNRGMQRIHHKTSGYSDAPGHREIVLGNKQVTHRLLKPVITMT